MKKQTFYITLKDLRQPPKPVQGFIFKKDNIYFGVHRSLEDPKKWNVSDIKNGMAVVMNARTIKDAKNGLTGHLMDEIIHYKRFPKKHKNYDLITMIENRIRQTFIVDKNDLYFKVYSEIYTSEEH